MVLGPMESSQRIGRRQQTRWVWSNWHIRGWTHLQHVPWIRFAVTHVAPFAARLMQVLAIRLAHTASDRTVVHALRVRVAGADACDPLARGLVSVLLALLVRSVRPVCAFGGAHSTSYGTLAQHVVPVGLALALDGPVHAELWPVFAFVRAPTAGERAPQVHVILVRLALAVDLPLVAIWLAIRTEGEHIKCGHKE